MIYLHLLTKTNAEILALTMLYRPFAVRAFARSRAIIEPSPRLFVEYFTYTA